MRGLVEDTKKLSLSNSKNNNNNSSGKTTSTKMATAAGVTTASKSAQNLKVANNKNTKPSISPKQLENKSTTQLKGTGVTNNVTGALQKQQKAQKQQQQQRQQQKLPGKAQQQSPNNNGTTTKVIATTATATTTKSSSTASSSSALASASTSMGSTTITLPKANHANTSEEIAGGVQDTIYLCNFRVSVDGEWLCLKELQDIDVGHQTNNGNNSGAIGNSGTLTGQRQKSGNSIGQRQSGNNKRYSGFSGLQSLEDNVRDPAEIERSNLVNICKLVVKELLEQSLRYGRMLDSDHLPLQHFFIVIEHVLGHGLRPKKGLLGPRKELWDLLQSVENYCPEAQDITASVRDLPTVRTHIGRARAWLRIALMQKKLADYLQALIEHRDDALYEYYEPYALMLSDEVVVIMGILVGLNVIDCNLCVKEEDLDSQQGVIDFSLYLRSSSRNADNEEDANTQMIESNGEQPNMIAVLDQKNYIEELNRHLNATVTNLQAKIESLTTTNALMKEDLAIARNSLLALQAENQAMRQNFNANIQSDTSSNSGSTASTKATIESLNAELNEERKKNAELEKELKLQVSLKAESDMAMKLLEKDIHEKQDTIVSLRRQLDDIKQINLEMYRKLQECEDELNQKGEMVSRLQTRASQIGNILQSLERKYDSKLEQQQQTLTGNSMSGDLSPAARRQQNLQKFEALTKKSRQDIGPPMKRMHLKMDGIPPFNPNNYRKSPSTATSAGLCKNQTTPETPKNPLSVTPINKQELITPTSAKSFNVEFDDFVLMPTPIVEISSKSDYALATEN